MSFPALSALAIAIKSSLIGTIASCSSYDPQDYVVRYELSDATESTYRAFDGTVNGSPTYAAGVIGNAITLDGIADYITVPNDAELEPSNITVSAWVKPTGSGNRVICSNYRSAGSQSNGWRLMLTSSGVQFQILNEPNYGTASLSGSSIENGNWHHVVGTFDGTSVKLYYDGVLETTTAFAYTPAYISNAFRIGSILTNSGEAYFFDGAIDDVRMYNRALSDLEVAGIYNSTLAAPPSDFVAEWLFDSDGGETLGNHDATEVGSPTYASGKENNAASLNGSSQYFTVADHADLKPSVITVGAWVNTSLASSTSVLSTFQLLSSNFSGYNLRLNPTGVAYLAIYSDTGQVQGVDHNNATSIISIADGEWHHICGTYDGTNIVFYLDGVKTQTTAYSGGLVYNATITPSIGARKYDAGVDAYFDGLIDKTQLFDRVCTDAEIEAMAATYPAVCP